MKRNSAVLLFASLAALAGCQDATSTTSPNLSRSDAKNAASAQRAAEVRIMDACDPTTFAAVPGGCQRNGGMKFDTFLSILTATGSVPAWHFSPPDLYIREGDSFSATNYGGENHTFTEVDEFGGGIVPLLNQLSGNTEVAPECNTLGQSDFLSPGSRTPPDTPEEVGDEHYQCCIHPWMRMTVHIRAR